MRYGVGIDVSKGKSTIAIVDENFRLVERIMEVKHLRTPLEQVDDMLKRYGKENMKIVMEETGTYYLPIYNYFKEKGYVVISENAFKVNKYMDREIRKSKTDKKDAKKLAEYVIENYSRITPRYEEEEKYLELRILARNYEKLCNIRKELKIMVSNLSDLTFPGFYDLIESDNIEGALEVYRMYYHADLMREQKEEEVLNSIKDAFKDNRHKISARNIAKKMYQLSQECIPCIKNNQHLKNVIGETITNLEKVIVSTNNIITELKEKARELPEFEEIIKIRGIGEILAARVIAEIGDAKRFKDAGSLIAYSGIDAPAYQSGNVNIESRRISKRGNKHLRKVGYEIMMSIKKSGSMSKDNVIYEYIVQKEYEGKSKKVAKIAGMNKFFKIYYGIWKRLYKVPS